MAVEDWVPWWLPACRSGEYCYCPECQRVRKQNKAKGSEARREQLRQWKLER